MGKKFKLGRMVITASAKGTLFPADVATGVARHASGDWGDCCDAVRQKNEIASRKGGKLLSFYRDRHSARFWVHTDTKRHFTLVLVPIDFDNEG